MPRASLLLAFLLALSACRGSADDSPGAGAGDPGAGTSAGADQASEDPAGGPPGEPGGEPGVPGSPRPEAAFRVGDGRCFVYPGWVAVVRPRSSNVGEDIVVAARPDGGDARTLCTTPPARPAASFTVADSPDFFFGIVGDLLFVDNGTGPNGRTLLLVDLTDGQTVFEADYEEPVEVDGDVLTFTEPVDDFSAMEGLVATGVNCPQAEEWFDTGFAVGVNRVVRYDLAARTRETSDELVCVPLQ